MFQSEILYYDFLIKIWDIFKANRMFCLHYLQMKRSSVIMITNHYTPTFSLNPFPFLFFLDLLLLLLLLLAKGKYRLRLRLRLRLREEENQL